MSASAKFAAAQRARGSKPKSRGLMSRAGGPGFTLKLKKIRLFFCDVDGVLTDGTVTIGADRETKRFYVQDGLGLRLLQRSGVKVGWVSNRRSEATAARARELNVDFLHQVEGSKVDAVEQILRQEKCDWEEICYVGDDLVDLGVMKRAGVAVAVANAIEEVQAVADYVTAFSGGAGAVRETIELILKAQGRWGPIIQEYSA